MLDVQCLHTRTGGRQQYCMRAWNEHEPLEIIKLMQIGEMNKLQVNATISNVMFPFLFSFFWF